MSSVKTVALSRAVFTVAADRLAGQAEQVARFTQTGRSWQGWCSWEVLDGCLAAGWTATPDQMRAIFSNWEELVCEESPSPPFRLRFAAIRPSL